MSSDKKKQEYIDLAQRGLKIEAEIQDLEAQLIDRKTLLDVISDKIEKFQQASPVPEEVQHNKTIKAIIDLVADELFIDREKVTYESNFFDDLGADNTDRLRLIVAFEELFDHYVEDSDIEKIATVKDVFDYCDRERLSV